MAGRPWPGSLGRLLVMATLVFSGVFTCAAVGVRTWFAWRTDIAAMDADLMLIDQVFERALSKAIWDMDRDELRRHVATLSHVRSVGYVALRILHPGRPAEVLEFRRPGSAGSAYSPSLHRVLKFEPYAGGAETIGELTLEGDDRILWAQLKSALVPIIVAQIIQSALLAALIMMLFNRSVTLHVRRIAQHLAGVTPETLGHRLQLVRNPGRRDELSLLVSGINQLQAFLAEYLARQRAAERDLAAHRDRLAELVDEQTAELRAANVRLEELTRVDPLTRLANRRHFDEVKETEFRRSKRLRLPMSVLLCDVDYFKRYNDTYGHARGDECLQEVADTLKGTFSRAGELAARIGGEEFVVLLPGTELQQALTAAERLRRQLAARAIPHAGSDVATHVSLSIGAAQLDVATMDTFDDLMQRADQALYRAKNMGRNRVAT